MSGEQTLRDMTKLDGYEVQRNRAERLEKENSALLGALIGVAGAFLALLIWEVGT